MLACGLGEPRSWLPTAELATKIRPGRRYMVRARTSLADDPPRPRRWVPRTNESRVCGTAQMRKVPSGQCLMAELQATNTTTPTGFLQPIRQGKVRLFPASEYLLTLQVDRVHHSRTSYSSP
jgi:hypothetical protein